MTELSQDAEPGARAMRHDVMRVSRGKPCHWVTIHEVAQRLGLGDEAAEAARPAAQRAPECGIGPARLTLMDVVVDLDGTLADCTHRLHHIRGRRRKNWDAFFAGWK